GTQWETFPVKPNDFVFELKADTINTFLYVGGQFTAVAGEPSVGSAMWDGFNWHPLGDYCGATVWQQAMEIYRGDLYTGGGLIDNEGNLDMYIAKWNGESWDSIGGNFSSSIFALEIFRDTLYIGGAFRTWDSIQNGGGIRSKGMVKLYMPDNGCDYLKPRINTYADTFYLNGGEAVVNLYNNNPYVDSWEWDFGSSTSSVTATQAVEYTYTQVGEYNVQVTVTNGECVKTANKTIYIELGNEIKNFEQIDMQVFPTPSNHDFTVQVSLPNYQNAEIKIAGLNGHLKDIIPVTSETTVIPTKGWSAGTYICNLFIEGKLVKVEKLVFE
ncbi:MAG: PKD domain-containing protein, partial [Clostridia bacterium]|nr:PKD domain-containing protein [Clostridia bacterium]